MDGPQRGPSKNLQFITFTDFKQSINPETKRKVRSHARRRAHQDTKDGAHKSKSKVIVLDTAPLLCGQLPGQHYETPEMLPAALSSPDRLGAGRLDPFAAHPIALNAQTQELVDHLRGEFCPMFRTMTRIGFFAIMKDPAGFYQILSTSASHMEQLRGTGAKSPAAITLTTRALQSLNSRLTDPRMSSSDGIIASVLAFCCHGVMFGDLKGSLLHLKGLEEILRLRGDLSTLNPVLRIVLCWVDTSIAFNHVIPPRFPVPYDVLPKVNKQLPLSASINGHMPLMEAHFTDDFAAAVDNLYRLNQLLTEKASAGDLWRDGLFAGHAGLMTQDAYRIGSILYLGSVRRMFGINPYISPDGDSQVRALKGAITSVEARGQRFNDRVLLWLLFIGSMESIVTQDHQWFVSNLVQTIVRVGCQSWDEVLDRAREVLWVEGISPKEFEISRGEVSTELLSSYGYILT